MSKPYKIAVVGIGGVGGFFGGKLAYYYSQNDLVEVNFIARGENLKAIKANGLKLITPQDEKIIYPHKVTNDANS